MFKLNNRPFEAASQRGAEPSHYGTSLAQRRADAIQARARAAEARPQLIKAPVSSPSYEAPLAGTEDAVSLRLAEELDYIRRLIENAAGDLAVDPILVQRHMGAMQSFDLIGQLVAHVAKVLSVADREEAIDKIGMLDLRARLQRKPLSEPSTRD